MKMRTTIDVPEDLLRLAKAEAALRGLRLKDVVRDALQRLLSEAGGSLNPTPPDSLDEQKLAADCVFPLVTGAAGPALRDLRGGGAQSFLDEEDVERDSRPR